MLDSIFDPQLTTFNFIGDSVGGNELAIDINSSPQYKQQAATRANVGKYDGKQQQTELATRKSNHVVEKDRRSNLDLVIDCKHSNDSSSQEQELVAPIIQSYSTGVRISDMIFSCMIAKNRTLFFESFVSYHD